MLKIKVRIHLHVPKQNQNKFKSLLDLCIASRGSFSNFNSYFLYIKTNEDPTAMGDPMILWSLLSLKLPFNMHLIKILQAIQFVASISCLNSACKAKPLLSLQWSHI